MTMASKADTLVADYLKRLNMELRGLPRARRRELLEEISEHIAEARAGLEADDEAGVRTLLDRLGDPADIAAEARERFGVRERAGVRDVVALVLLLVGGVVLPVIGWVIGVVLLWISEAWSTRDKLIGTLVVPGGLLVPLGLGLVSGESAGCIEISSGGPGPRTARTCDAGGGGIEPLELALVILLVLAPLVTTVYLAARLRRRQVPAAA
jgi:uncharacterized membrane protein